MKSVDFENNEHLSSGKLKKAILTQASPWYDRFLFWTEPPEFVDDILLADLLRIERFYRQEGLLEAIVKDYRVTYNDAGDRAGITIVVEEGEPTLIGRVDFFSTNDEALPIPTNELMKITHLEAGKRYREEDLKKDYNKIVERFSNRGYPYIDAKARPVIDRENHRVELEWLLDSGPLCSFGEIKVAGNESVSKNVILRGLGFKPGNQFVRNKLVYAQSQVYRLELFRYVNLRALDLNERPTSIPVEVQVREADLRTLKFGVGVGSEEGFRAFARWRHRNFLGGGRILSLYARHANRIVPLQLDLQLNQPFFISNRNDLTVGPFFLWEDEPGYEARRLGAEATFLRRLTRRTSAFLNVRMERDTVTVRGDSPDRPDDFFNKSIVGIGINRNSSDELFNPTRGSITQVRLEESGRFLTTPFRYLKFSAEYRKYNEIEPNHILAWRVFYGTMPPIRGSEETPVEERFYAGGSYSVRGWGRQLLGPLDVQTSVDETTGRIDSTIVPIGGNSKFEGSFEMRFPVVGQLYGALFLDFGNVWRTWDSFDPFDLKYSIGVGVRYNSIVGPIRVDIARRINEQPLDDSSYQIHFSLGQAF